MLDEPQRRLKGKVAAGSYKEVRILIDALRTTEPDRVPKGLVHKQCAPVSRQLTWDQSII
jgi:hypothetical protein